MNKNQKKKRNMPRYKRILRYQCWELSKGLRLRERIANANQWCSSHPRKFMGIVLGICIFFLLFSLVSLFTSSLGANNESQQDENFISDKIETIQPTLDGMRQIQDSKRMENYELKKLTERGLQIKNELDSLLGLEYKTHEDSVRIASYYHRLQDIVNFLKTDKK